MQTHVSETTATGYQTPVTWTGVAVATLLAAAFPVALVALAYPVVAGTALLAVGAVGAVVATR
jgi:hypothetical protein